MKPVDFAYARPQTLADACALLAGNDAAKVLAGGQTLGPMLNLRFVQPDLVVDVTRIRDLKRVEERDDAIVLGACITHAAIEDGKTPDASAGMMAQVAQRIAYRAVRTRGTIGGSLAHSDPAADWLTCLLALGASVSITGAGGRREMTLDAFCRGVMETALGAAEVLDGVIIPRLPRGARWGYHKICRKTGEFADAIGAVVASENGCRLVSGGTGTRPLVIETGSADLAGAEFGAAALSRRLGELGMDGDVYALKVHVAALRRAIEGAEAA